MPKKLRVVFVLESPPSGGGYFYNPNGRVSEILFRSFMQLIKFSATTKDLGLKEFARQGYLLVDPIYIPVDKLDDKEADILILKNYKEFTKDLNKLIDNKKKTPIILVKSNILKILEKPLISDGYNVVNNGLMVPFPLHYHTKNFLERLKKLLAVIK